MGRHDMSGRNMYGQPCPVPPQESVEAIKWRIRPRSRIERISDDCWFYSCSKYSVRPVIPVGRFVHVEK